MNITSLFTIFLSAFTLLMSNCTAQPAKDASDFNDAKAAIAKSNELYFQAFVKNDSSLFINRYAEDGCIMFSSKEAMCGRGAHTDFYKTAYDIIGVRNGKFITKAIYGNGNQYVTEEGLWQLFDKNNLMFDDGKYLVLWKKTSEGWKMFRDCFNSNHDVQ